MFSQIAEIFKPWSYSKETSVTCPFKFLLEYVVKLPKDLIEKSEYIGSKVGTLQHEVLEFLLGVIKDNTNYDIAKLSTMYDNFIDNRMEPIFDSERSTLDMSKAGIVNYVIRIANIQKTHPNFKFYVEKELAMSSDFKPVDYDQFNAQQDFSKRAIYRGKIDFVAFLPNVKLSVIDFKGGNYQAMMSDSLKQQLFTYMVMLFKMYPMFKNLKEYDMKLFLLTLNRIVPGGNFNSDYIDEVIVPEFITRVNTAAEVCKGNMFATNSKANCNYCNYKNACKNLTEVQTESGPKFLNLKEIVRDYGVVKIPNLTLSEIEGDIKKPRSCKVFLKYKDKLLSELA